MGVPRRRNPIASRRRTDDDGDGEGSAAGQEDDLSSLGSAPSEADVNADADAEGSDGSRTLASRKGGAKKRNGHTFARESNGKAPDQTSSPKPMGFSAKMADTEAMMNGLRIADDGEAIEFDEAIQAPGGAMPQVAAEGDASLNKMESLADRRRREHEEYKKKREEDPTFIPNRGGFFMHDQRSLGLGQNGFRPAGRGRGRGRGGYGILPSFLPQAVPTPSDAPWAHDLHETVANAEPGKLEAVKSNQLPASIQQNKAPVSASTSSPPNRMFSQTTHIGNVQLRVFIPGMKDPVNFSGVPVKQHTRLPHHRPPLRRDKPVRVSLPEIPPRYIFPATDRSFIFIPRAMRPNQQGFGRGRVRGSFSVYGGLASARNSVFGGSVYSPSVAMSRRSSLARELGRDGVASPAGSAMSRNRNVMVDAGKPVVRLPPAADQAALPVQNPQLPHFGGNPAPVVNLPQPQAYPILQSTIVQNGASSLPMHQPRPQKQVSVAEIESPAALNFPPPQQQQQQPFHQQVPAVLGGPAFAQDSNLLPHSRHPSHPSQRGTPLSQIPERAIHAQPFQPYPFQQAPQFYPHQYPTPVYYYTPPPPSVATPSMGTAPVSAPAYVSGQQYPYVVASAPLPATAEPTAQPGMVAHESNGMVYYYDASQLAASTEDPSGYPQIGFVPSSGYVVPQGTMFYPTQ